MKPASPITGLIIAIALAICFTTSPVMAGNARAPSIADDVGWLAELDEVTVTVDNFVRAETEMQLDRYQDLAGGVNKWLHFRTPTPIENQPTIRMNRDTLYSMAVVDISKGATVKMPDAGDRYMSVMVVNQDHFINEVFYGGGAHKLDVRRFDTPYVAVVVRALVDASDLDDVAAVNALQDKMVIEAKSARPFIKPNYDEDTYRPVFEAAVELSRAVPDASRTFGRREDVDPVRHFLGTAFGFGGLPERHASYLNVEPRLPVGEFKIEVGEVPVDAFWSVSLYNADGFFEENDRDAYIMNSVNVTRDDDGSVTIHLGGCDDDRVNCLPIMQGWNYAVRLYQPRKQILDGSWTFPSVQPVGN